MSTSAQLFKRAKKFIPGGVNSPVRAFHAVEGSPLFIDRGEGAYLFDADGKPYVDYIGSWGSLILGHAHPRVINAVKSALDNGLGFGASTEVEIKLAEKVCQLMPNIEHVRMVNSGTEATMSAIRLARGSTGRDKIIKFEGCYHGHTDALLVKGGSGLLTLGKPSSAGVPEDFTKHTLMASFNDLDSVQQLFEQHASDIACIILEPIAGNMNLVPAEREFLLGLRELCNQYGALLIFDEVMTGFRISIGGAQAYYSIKPDLTTLGKIIGGGLPVGAFGGREDIMRHIAPEGDVYQAGTLSGNPIAMTAGLETLRVLEETNPYPALEKMTQQLVAGLQSAANEQSAPFHTQSMHSMFGLFFTENESIKTYQDVMQCNLARFKSFHATMLKNGIYLAPSAFEAGFVSIAHDKAVVDKTIDAAMCAFKLF